MTESGGLLTEKVEAVATAGPLERAYAFARAHWDLIALAAVLVVTLLIRLRFFGHILSYDEAWNVISARAAATGQRSDMFFENFYRHPPLYLGLATLYMKVFRSGEGFMKALSLVCSLGTTVVLFATMRRHVDRLTGVLSALAFAVMPVAAVFDTWVKQDSMAILFAALFVYFFLAERYYLAGFFLGLGILTKEIVVFVFPAVAAYTLLSYSRQRLYGLIRCAGAGFVMSFWWFLFFSSTSGEFLKFFLGKSLVNRWFYQPWYYYITRLPTDLSWLVLVFMLAGIVFWAVSRSGRRGEECEEREERGRRPEDPVLLFICWFVLVLLVLTVSRGKPVWMIYSAAVPAAAIAGYGMRRFIGLKMLKPAALWAILGALIAVTLVFSFTMSHDRYMEDSGSWLETAGDHRIAMAMNAMLKPGEVVLISKYNVTPNLLYYLKIYEPGSIQELRRKDTEGKWLKLAEGARSEGKTVYLVDRDFPLYLLGSYVKALGPDILLLKTTADHSMGLAEQLEGIPHETVGRGYIFRSRDLLGDDREETTK